MAGLPAWKRPEPLRVGDQRVGFYGGKQVADPGPAMSGSVKNLGHSLLPLSGISQADQPKAGK